MALEVYINRLDNYLHQIVSSSAIPAPRVKEAISYSLFPGGKRLRPLLTYLSGELLGLPLACLDPMAGAIEFMHCYSLIHDDLPAMDNDDFRRGKPSCHRAFDEATAILAGDGLQGMAVDLLITTLPGYLPLDKTLAVVKELVQATGVQGMVSGQSLDLSELSKQSLSENELKLIHHLKTGCLFSACINMPLLAASPLPKEQTLLRNFAQILGLVFQMQDDYLDHYAPESLGKLRGSDASNQKITFAVLHNQQSLLSLIDEHYKKSLGLLTQLEKNHERLQQLIIELWNRTNQQG